MADTTTVLNPGVGGDILDESSVVQTDGVTVAKRPRVEVALAGDGTPRLVGSDFQLPTHDERVLVVLSSILEEMRAIRLLMESLTS